MLYCPAISNTIVSPQEFAGNASTGRFNGYCLVDQPGCCRLLLSHSETSDSSFVNLTRDNDLYYICDSPKKVHSVKVNHQMQAELWHQRLGHPGPTQLSALAEHATGLPPRLTNDLHPMHSCQVCSDAKIKRAPMGTTADTDPIQPGTRFHLDFGFIRASSEDYGVTKQKGKRVVTSFDGFNTFLLIVCAKTRFTWVFCQQSKSPPTEILDSFLKSSGLKDGPRSLRMDQGGELARSSEIGRVAAANGYVIEPTGSDAASENGKVERLNGTFGAMVRSLLFGSGMSPKFWSSALVHAVYLKNRMYHSALRRTPYEAWTGVKPDIAHIRTFGALVTARKPGHRPAKADRHTAHGMLLGYGATAKHVRYYDLTSGREKLSTHHVIDEAHYGATKRPPGAQVLMNMGYPIPPEPDPVAQASPPRSVYPSKSTLKLPSIGIANLVPLPLNEFTPAPVAVAARISTEEVHRDSAVTVEFSSDPYDPSFDEEISIKGFDSLAGLRVVHHGDRDRCQLSNIEKGAPAHRIAQWRSRLRHAFILRIDGLAVHSKADISAAIARVRASNRDTAVFTFCKDGAPNSLSNVGLPQLYFDQLRMLNEHIRNACAAVRKVATETKLHRRHLKKGPDWPEWQAAEWKQLDNYHKQGMFGIPTSAPALAAIFFWVWIYTIKIHEDNRKKVRGVCDGSTRGGQAQVTGNTYAPTPQQVDFRLQCALATTWGLFMFHADVANAFAEADGTDQVYYMRVDDVFRDWWNNRFPDMPLPPNAVVPVKKNLQGHPEAPKQWSKKIDKLLKQLGFKATTHAPCLYIGTFDGQLVLFLRQVDDFSIACASETTYEALCAKLDTFFQVPMTRYGRMTHFNGVDVVQSDHHISIHVGEYLKQVFKSYGWENMHPTSLPMDASNEFVRRLDEAKPLSLAERDKYEKNMFRYRAAIGELIWPMITARPELSYPVVKLSQFSAAPAAIHFEAVKKIFQFLSGTITDGITYTRKVPLSTGGSPVTVPPRRSNPHDMADDHILPLTDLDRLIGYSDSDWAMDIRHRRSITGIIFMLSGGAIAWKTRVQPTVSLSTAEAEFLAASDCGRLALFLRAVLLELGYEQTHATPIFEDNRACVLVSESAHPTRQMRHLDIREFALQDWTERDLVTLISCPSHSNCSDMLTKQVGSILYARHADTITGRLWFFRLHQDLSASTATARVESGGV